MIAEFTAVYSQTHEGYIDPNTDDFDKVMINGKYVVALERNDEITTVVCTNAVYNVLANYEDVILKLFSNRDA